MSGREEDNPYDHLSADDVYMSGDPYRNFNFMVAIEAAEDDDGGLIGVAGFQEVSGLEIEVEPHTYEEGGRHGQPHHLPGTVTHPDLTLKRGLTNSTKLIDWMGDVVTALTGPADSTKLTECMRSVWIFLQSGLWYWEGEKGSSSLENKGTWRWKASQAYPVKWSGPDLDATSSDGVAIQELTLTHAGLRKLE